MAPIARDLLTTCAVAVAAWLKRQGVGPAGAVAAIGRIMPLLAAAVEGDRLLLCSLDRDGLRAMVGDRDAPELDAFVDRAHALGAPLMGLDPSAVAAAGRSLILCREGTDAPVRALH